MFKWNKACLILVTPIFILLSHYLAVFPHEYAHSFTAWIMGFKNNPLDLHYGGTSLSNLLLLSNIDENVDYKTIYSLGYRFPIALIAFAGPGIANGLLYILSLILLNNDTIKKRPYLFYFLFWFNLMNLGNFYDYIPIRVFSPHGDMTAIEFGLNISPWWLFIIGGYLVAFLIWHFFTRTLISAYINLNLNTTFEKAFVMIVSVFILFGFFGGIIGAISSPGGNGDLAYFMSVTSFLIIPGIIIAAWPSRAWVQDRIKTAKY